MRNVAIAGAVANFMELDRPSQRASQTLSKLKQHQQRCKLNPAGNWLAGYGLHSTPLTSSNDLCWLAVLLLTIIPNACCGAGGSPKNAKCENGKCVTTYPSPGRRMWAVLQRPCLGQKPLLS